MHHAGLVHFPNQFSGAFQEGVQRGCGHWRIGARGRGDGRELPHPPIADYVAGHEAVEQEIAAAAARIAPEGERLEGRDSRRAQRGGDTERAQPPTGETKLERRPASGFDRIGLEDAWPRPRNVRMPDGAVPTPVRHESLPREPRRSAGGDPVADGFRSGFRQMEPSAWNALAGRFHDGAAGVSCEWFLVSSR